jgi:hypothetical protein
MKTPFEIPLSGNAGYAVPVAYEIDTVVDVKYAGRPNARYIWLRYSIGDAGIVCDFRLGWN